MITNVILVEQYIQKCDCGIWTSRYRNAIPLTRAWCLFEVYCTVETKSRFEVAMSSAEHRSFIVDVSQDVRVVNQMIGDVDGRKSEAWNPEDKRRIFDAVQNTAGFDTVNSTVFEVMRSWVVSALETAMNIEQDKGERAGLQCTLGELLRRQGQYDRALPLLLSSVEYRQKNRGQGHPNTLATMHNLANLYYAKGDYDSALPLYLQCMEIRKEKLGPDHPDTLTSMNNLAGLYYAKRDYDSALPLYLQCVKVRKKKLGPDHPDALTLVNGLVGLYESMGDHGSALPLISVPRRQGSL